MTLSVHGMMSILWTTIFHNEDMLDDLQVSPNGPVGTITEHITMPNGPTKD